MRAKLVNEIKFERGRDPLDAMDAGNPLKRAEKN